MTTSGNRGEPTTVQPWWNVEVVPGPGAANVAPNVRPPRWPRDPIARAALEAWSAAASPTILQVVGLDFRDCDLTGVEFYGLVATRCDFSNTTLVGTDLAGSWLDDVSFRDADLRGAHFGKAHVSDSSFERAALGHAKFRRTELYRCSFADADLTGADLDCYVEDCDLSRADVSYSPRFSLLARNTEVTGLRARGVLGDVRGSLTITSAGRRRTLTSEQTHELFAQAGAAVTVRP